MSSPTVRTALNAEIETLAGAIPVFDLSDYVEIKDLPLNDTQQAILLQYVASSDRIATIGGQTSVSFEETGTVGIHWLCPTGFESAPILAAAETMRQALRARRLGDLVVESIEPFSDSGSPIDVDGGWTGFSSLLYYNLRTC